ncbi:hypothetical protein CYMTET_13171 [Cymbomonas tetramitiformis]|uniref:Carotenoid oxygenase n=1 Tax=Cymbomonas tetramitiformis TaxID=36881 RepID=A0AAE0GIM4_9CHLO|nr:hypothetical protein CYMTET_13171 [Cymbomonas tetramitiformis]|eukprot:gene17220-20487_t
MRRCLFLLLLNVVVGFDESGFLHWFTSELREVCDAPLQFAGTVPTYLENATFVQTGPGRFSFGDTRFTHVMDGYSKINTVAFGRGAARYTSQFLRSKFLNESMAKGRIAPSMFVGSVVPPQHWGPAQALGPNDNNYIKMRQIGVQKLLLADTMISTAVEDNFVTFEHDIRSRLLSLSVPGVPWKDDLEPKADMCMLGTMAHGHEDPDTGIFTGAMGCFGMAGSYHVVFTIRPEAPTMRHPLAKISLPKGRSASYMHDFAATPRYIVLIAEPLFMDLPKVLEGAPLGRGGLRTTGDETLFQIVNREDGSVRTLSAPGFIFGHVVNAWEENASGDILIDLTWYAANNATTLGWFNRWQLEYLQEPGVRESWPRSKVMRYRLPANGSVTWELLFPEEKGRNDFETPKINEQYTGLKYCVSYFMQFHSDEYRDGGRNSTIISSSPMGAVGIAKRNLCTGEVMGWYQANEYPSEIQFVPDPSGTAEDDGVLLGIVFNAKANSSYFHILDARTMRMIAKADLPIKVPFLIHSSFFPAR